MARTLIGQLILRLRAEGLGEVKQVVTTMKDVENAARRLGGTGTRSWGQGFQRNLDKLNLTAEKVREVEQSWIRLHNSIRSRGLDSAMRGAEVSHWKTNTLSALAAQRLAIDEHFKKVEASARSRKPGGSISPS